MQGAASLRSAAPGQTINTSATYVEFRTDAPSNCRAPRTGLGRVNFVVAMLPAQRKAELRSSSTSSPQNRSLLRGSTFMPAVYSDREIRTGQEGNIFTEAGIVCRYGLLRTHMQPPGRSVHSSGLGFLLHRMHTPAVSSSFIVSSFDCAGDYAHAVMQTDVSSISDGYRAFQNTKHARAHIHSWPGSS